MIDLAVVEHLMLHGPVAGESVGVDDRVGLYVLADSANEIRGRHVGNRVGADTSLALDHSEHGLLLTTGAPTTMRPARWHTTSRRTALFATDIGFIGLNRSGEDHVVLHHSSLRMSVNIRHAVL